MNLLITGVLDGHNRFPPEQLVQQLQQEGWAPRGTAETKERAIRKALHDLGTWIKDWYRAEPPGEARIELTSSGEVRLFIDGPTDVDYHSMIRYVLDQLPIACNRIFAGRESASQDADMLFPPPPHVPSAFHWVWRLFPKQLVGNFTETDLAMLKTAVYRLSMDRLVGHLAHYAQHHNEVVLVHYHWDTTWELNARNLIEGLRRFIAFGRGKQVHHILGVSEHDLLNDERWFRLCRSASAWHAGGHCVYVATDKLLIELKELGVSNVLSLPGWCSVEFFQDDFPFHFTFEPTETHRGAVVSSITNRLPATFSQFRLVDASDNNHNVIRTRLKDVT